MGALRAQIEKHVPKRPMCPPYCILCIFHGHFGFCMCPYSYNTCPIVQGEWHRFPGGSGQSKSRTDRKPASAGAICLNEDPTRSG